MVLRLTETRSMTIEFKMYNSNDQQLQTSKQCLLLNKFIKTSINHYPQFKICRLNDIVILEPPILEGESSSLGPVLGWLHKVHAEALVAVG